MALECTLAALAKVDQTDPDAVQALLQTCIGTLLDPTLWEWVLALTLGLRRDRRHDRLGERTLARGVRLGRSARADRLAGDRALEIEPCANVPNAAAATSPTRRSVVHAESISASTRTSRRARA